LRLSDVSQLWPEEGAVRVGPNPAALPSARRPGVVGPNRFDDPEGTFAVRYLADTLRGCLIELLARFRHNDDAEARISSVANVDPDDGAHPGPAAIADWCKLQQVAAQCHLAQPREVLLVSVNDAALLADLNQHPQVRAALDIAAKQGLCNKRAELDGATIRLSGPIGRSITQAASRALYDHEPRPSGLAYRSRLDDEERCWALYGETKVIFPEPIPLSPDNQEHRSVARTVAHLYKLELPAEWA
jgi:hypothetical protein